MKLGFCNSCAKWDAFLKEKGSEHLQSFAWGEFKKKYQSVWRIAVTDNSGKIKGLCQIFEENLPIGKYLYIPRGPVAEKKEIKEVLIKGIKEKLGSGSIFIKLEPEEDFAIGRNSFHSIQPKKTLIINIERSQEDLLLSFRKSTRYNIRSAQKKGVEVKESNNIDAFYDLLLETNKRQGFTGYKKSYFEEMLKKTDSTLFIASYMGEIVAGAIILVFGETAFYLHSASQSRKNNLNATSLICFKAMEFAKEKGCKRYDFWGVDSVKFPGVTLFKKGFGGEEKKYPSPKDIPLQKIKYEAYSLASRVLKK